MGLFTSVSRAAKKEIYSQVKTDEGRKATMEFLAELNPSVVSRVMHPFAKRDPFSLINDKVDLHAAFDDKVFPKRADAQKKLDSLGLAKSGHQIDTKHYDQLKRVVDERKLDSKALTKAYVTSPEIKDRAGKPININPNSTRSIAIHKLDNPEKAVDKIHGAFKNFDCVDQAKFLKRLDFSKTKLDMASFDKLDATAKSLSLDIFKDLGVKPQNLITKTISTPHLTQLFVKAVETSKPLDLKGLDISKCNLEKAMDAAETRLAADSKTLKGVRISTPNFEGSKMSHFQQQVFDKLLLGRTPSQPPIDTSRSSVKGNVAKVMPEDVDSMFVRLLNKVGKTLGASGDIAQTRDQKAERVAANVR